MTLLKLQIKAFSILIHEGISHEGFVWKSVCINFLLAFSTTLSIGSAEARLSSHGISHADNFQAQLIYDALVAEIYIQLGDEKLAVDHYQHLTVISDDPAIARRVTVLATATGQLKRALDTSKRWVELAPDNLEAGQYLALLYLRNSQFTESAHQLDKLVKQANKSLNLNDIKDRESNKQDVANSESLKFIGSMLAAESHHDKAYKVFKLYLKQFGKGKYQSQKKLISADLAMKAKNYTAVISLLEFLDDLDPQNLVDAAAMKAKAYHRSNQTVEAIQVLNSIKDYKETKDSSRLELVRLLVLDKKKKRALPILQKLVTKHQKNNELLKSLIALQIDQSFLKNAENNINKLRLTDKYQDDAEYFRGELLEKKGNFNEALKSYNNVKDGSFLNIAHKKVIYITQKAKGQQALDELFSLKQKNAEKVSDKAYWIKLQADKVFDEKKYKQALVLYNKAIQLTPDNTHYYYYRGLLHERMTNLDLAEKDFNFVLKKRNNDADALNALGYMLSVNTQRLIEAKNYIKKAFEIKPNDPVIMDSLGYILFKMGDLSAAERYLRKAFRLMKNPEVASHLISVLSKSNQHQEAQLIFEEMNEKYPDNHILNNVKQYLHADL